MSVSINLPLDDVLQSVERPVTFSVIRRLMELTQISSKTQIRFYGEDGKAAQFNSTLTQDAESNNLWPHRENITIEVDEDHDPDRMLNMAVKAPEQNYVFYDKGLNIILRPSYSSTVVSIKVLYKAVDKNQANKWRNEMRTRYAMLRESFLHEITYSWHVPDEMLVIMQELHRLREKVAGHGDTFQDWLTKHLTNRATQVTNQSGTDSFLAIRERQAFVQGVFDFEAVPEKASRDDEPNLWVTSFTYKFRYDKPIEAVFNYPIIVHQSMLSRKWRPTEPTYTYEGVLKQFSYSIEKFSKFTTDNQALRHYGNRGLNLPHYDNFVLRSNPAATVRAMLVLCSLSEADPRSLLNLGDLGHFNLDPDVLAFMKTEYACMVQGYNSIFQLHHYVDGRIQDQSDLAINANLDVSLAADGDLRKAHRVRLGLVVDPLFMSKDAIARVRNNPVVACKVLNAINGGLTDLSNQRDIGKSRMTVAELQQFACIYDNNYRVVSEFSDMAHDPNRVIPMALVENLFIVAGRKE